MSIREIELLSEEGAKQVLAQIIEQLDLLDEQDYFGTEGWRHSFGLED